MRILAVLILMMFFATPVYAGACDSSDEWSRIVVDDAKAAVKIWYDPREDGRETSYVDIWYVYPDERVEGACVRLDAGGYSPHIYQWLKSKDPDSHAHARNVIEVQGLAQKLLKYADPLGD
ncbi:hypothetical protein HYT05_00440 [Candidatus Kaiserbacteria bacterium]|nr:hypothetical protein [Candidatus Kaiserbacteria bacterium]